MPGEETRYGLPYALLADAPDEEAISKSLVETLAKADVGAHGRLLAQGGGVATRSDWEFTANVNSATGELGSVGAAGGIAFCPDPGAGLGSAFMMTNNTNATIAKKVLGSGALPAAGKFTCVNFELKAVKWNQPGTVSTKAGAEKTTQKEAEESEPATSAASIRLRSVIVRNNAGVFEIVSQTDKRLGILHAGPWVSVPNINAKLTANRPVFVRTEMAGRLFRFEGQLEVKAAETLAKGETILELPIQYGAQSTSTQKMSTAVNNAGAAELAILEWAASLPGKFLLLSNNITAGKQIMLDGLVVPRMNF